MYWGHLIYITPSRIQRFHSIFQLYTVCGITILFFGNKIINTRTKEASDIITSVSLQGYNNVRGVVMHPPAFDFLNLHYIAYNGHVVQGALTKCTAKRYRCRELQAQISLHAKQANSINILSCAIHNRSLGPRL